MVWFDAMQYKGKEEGKIKNRTLYNILGISKDGYKQLLGRYISESEGANFWLSVRALKKAFHQAKETNELIHHSDRGIQYCSNLYTQILKRNKIAISMTKENHCYENAITELVNGILKDEF